MSDTRPIVVITGATSGLGLALATLYHARNARLVLVGRRPVEELDPTLFSPTCYCQVDLSDADAATTVERWMHAHAITHIDLLIHNAGIGSYGPVRGQHAATIRNLVDTNLRAPVALTHQLLPLVVRRKGKIAFISSVAATLPAPDYAVYAATKAALEGFARNLRIELGRTATVQTIVPGAIRTAMHEKSGAPVAALGWHRFPPPEVVARQIVRAIDMKRDVVTIGAANRAVRVAGHLFPRVIERIVARRRR